MPGIYGFVSEHPANLEIASRQLDCMRKALRQPAHGNLEKHLSAGAAFSITTVPSSMASQSYLDRNRGLLALLDGEIYELRSAKHRGEVSDLSVITSLFQEYDLELADKLVGQFNLLFWEEKRRRLVIVNDWHGFGSLFYCLSEGALRIAPEIKAILSCLAGAPPLDERGLAEYVHFWFMLRDRTFFNNVRLLPPASVLEYRDGKLNIQTYWKLTLSESQDETHDINDLADKGIELLRQSVRRRTAGRRRVGVTLSGGMDSRTLLAISCEQGKDVTAISYGHAPACEDYRIARRVLKVLKPKREVFEILSPTTLADNSSEFTWLTDGLTRADGSHVIRLAKTFKDEMDVLLNGIFGGHISIGSSFIYKDVDICRPSGPEKLYGRIYNWNALSDWWKERVFVPEFAAKCIRLVRESVEEEVRAWTNQATLLCNQIDLHCAHNVLRRYMNTVDAWKYFVDDQRPFADPYLLEFYGSIPPRLRTNHRVYSAIYLRHFPHLADIPWHHTGVPVYAERPKWRKIRRDIGWKWRYYVGRLSLGRINIPDPHYYVQHDQWMRTEKKVWNFIESILFDRRAMERGWYSKAGIQEVLRMERQGGMYTTVIVFLLSLELWARAFLDGDPAFAEGISR